MYVSVSTASPCVFLQCSGLYKSSHGKSNHESVKNEKKNDQIFLKCQVMFRSKNTLTYSGGVTLLKLRVKYQPKT